MHTDIPSGAGPVHRNWNEPYFSMCIARYENGGTAIPDTFGAWLANKLKSRHLSYRDFAGMIGQDSTRVKGMIQGKIRPREVTVQKIIDILGDGPVAWTLWSRDA